MIDGSPDDPTIDYLEAPGALPRLKALTVSPLTPFFFDRIPSTFQRLHTFACCPTSADHRISSKNQLIQTVIERATSVPTLRELRFFEGNVGGPGWIYILRREAAWHLELDLVVDRHGISKPDLGPFAKCADVTIVATAKIPRSVRRSIQL